MLTVTRAFDNGIGDAFRLLLTIPLLLVFVDLLVKILFLGLEGPIGGEIHQVGDPRLFSCGNHFGKGAFRTLVEFTGAVLDQIRLVKAPIGRFVVIVDQDEVPLGPCGLDILGRGNGGNTGLRSGVSL